MAPLQAKNLPILARLWIRRLRLAACCRSRRHRRFRLVLRYDSDVQDQSRGQETARIRSQISLTKLSEGEAMTIDSQIQKARNDFDREANGTHPKHLLLGKKQSKDYQAWIKTFSARKLAPSTSQKSWKDLPIVETEAEDQLVFE